MRRKAPRGGRGFTLVEMMVVISILLILLAVAMPIYNQSVTRAREENLRKNLWTLNHVIVQFTLDKQKGPQSLDELKGAGYIKSIPDDITGRNDTWVVDQDDSILSPDQTAPGIWRVQSGASGVALDGTPYSDW